MTDLLTDDPNDTGEIPRLPGEERTVIIRIDTGEATQRIDPRLIKAPSFDAVPRKVFDLDDTVTYLPATIGLAGPQSPPPPRPLPNPGPPPKPGYDLAAAQPIAPWERVAGADDTMAQTLLQGLGADLPEDGDDVVFRRPCGMPRSRRSVRYVLPADRAPWTGARHAKPAPLWTRVAILAGAAMVVGAVLGVAIIWAVAA